VKTGLGMSTWLLRIATLFPFGFMDSALKKMTGIDVVATKVRG